MKDHLRDVRPIPLLKPEEVPLLCKKIDRLKELLGGDLKSFDIENFSKKEQLEIRECLAAYHRFIKGNLRLVILISKKYRNTNYELSNIVQFGYLGLIRAVEKFDYSKSHRFNVYASFWIKQAITRGLVNTNSEIRLPIHINSRLIKAKRELRLNPNISKQDLANKIEITPEELDFALAKDYKVNSSAITSKTDGTIEELFCYEEHEETGNTREVLERALESLSETERFIVLARTGYNGRKKSLKSLAKKFESTEENISEILRLALEKLSKEKSLQVFSA
jgi:RNA polymerase primary sigma factor